MSSRRLIDSCVPGSGSTIDLGASILHSSLCLNTSYLLINDGESDITGKSRVSVWNTIWKFPTC